MRICPSIFLALIVSGPFLMARNPLLSGADPHAEFFERQLWIYPTGGGRPSELFAWSSEDFKSWEKHGPVFRLDDAPWVKDDGAPRHLAWAPSIILSGKHYYFYYSVGPQNPTPSRIGVARADSPAGPFVDSGKPLLTGGNGFEAIDPFVFKDPKSGTHYFYAGGSAGAKLRIFELNPDMVSFAREIQVDTPRHFTEGAFVHVHLSRYYLSYSHGSYRDHTYSVHYSTSATATGPWKYGGPILTSDSHHKGPGHHSLVRMPGTEQWLIVYHRWNKRQGRGPYQGKRDVCIDLLEHAEDGSIKPVRMTDEGVKSPRNE